MVLWLVVVVLLLRGLAAVLEPREPARAVPAPRAAVPAWPDDAARAFAAEFARAYLSYDPADPEASAAAVQAFATPLLASTIAPEYDEDAPRRKVGQVTVARVERVDDRHALVTVAAATGDGTTYLTVPVAHGANGGLVVSDLPSLSAPPPRATVEEESHESLATAERPAIADVITRFFRAYLAGEADGLEYLAPAGVHIGALAHEHELLDLTSLSLAEPAKGSERDVLASVRARDIETGAVYDLGYRVRLVREDSRWYVSAVNSTSRGG
jgi:hypothetical protein